MAAAGGLGAVGGYGAGKYNQYSFPKTTSSFGRHSFGNQHYGASTRGYGTNWGTNFGSGVGRYPQQKKGFSKKALGLGVGAGFLGGAALGVAGTMATYSVYHRYQEFKNLMAMRGFGQYGGGQYGDNGMGGIGGYQNNFYQQNQCLGGCPANAHCEWSFCECNFGYEKKWGRCVSPGVQVAPRPASFDPFVACTSTETTCQAIDMNLVCNTNLTVQAGGKCECKTDMRWNAATGECQLFLDVDCSAVTYDTPPAAAILEAVKKAEAEAAAAALAKQQQQQQLATNGTATTANVTAALPDFSFSETADLPPLNRTPTREESLATSLLTKIDAKKATEQELREAFCRDVDAYSFDLNTDNGRPKLCAEVPPNACAVVFDSHDCSGGWKLVIAEGQISFPYFSSYWKYRNDIDTVGVREGCMFTGFSGTEYYGNKIVLRGEPRNSWYVLEEHAQYQHMENDIESIKCQC
jgi:type II secretory pathway pseudopilin PulG